MHTLRKGDPCLDSERGRLVALLPGLRRVLLYSTLIPALLIMSQASTAGVKEVFAADAPPVTASEREYVIGPEDVLEISVWKNEDLSKVVTVRPDGMISLPLIGEVKAGGRTPVELQKAITRKLGRFQKNAVVSVLVQEINSYRVFILGEVTRPGTYSLKRRTTLLQALALAGGFTEFASKNRIIVIREGGGVKSGGEKMVIRFKDIVDAKKGLKGNLVLRPGDTIFVP